MFWDSVLAGLKVLTYWETYIAGLEYLAISLIPLVIVGGVMMKSESGAVVGCLSIFLLPVLQIAAMTVMILTLAPIIFGLAEDAAWSYPWDLITLAPLVFLKLIGILIIAVIVLAFIPIFGQFQSLHTLVHGGITLIFIAANFNLYPGLTEHINYAPGF